ncbi:hypothetical protein CIPAW_03G134500 [Carya illinoinensis]|uniref:No apical meristem-associated C-terminal domain-containing protein n=1 Tax=Carya illinoinensis TaxID=32201 RepID=A0A8T1R401_CARIL|nr:hypothetical protein CIPAW_03G134500 [Carya illinoinensis]
MDSQDPGHMYFINLLSEDPQLDPTYGGQSGTLPMTLNDSPPLPPNESIGARKSVRGANFTLEEDNFQFEHCWHLLKNQPKWIWRTTKDDPKQKKTMSPSLTPTPTRCSAATEDSVFDLEMENVIENEVIELDRPMGRKAEKGKRKAQGRQMEYDNERESIKLHLEDERLRLEAEKLKIEVEKKQSKIRQEDERLRLKAEKVKIAKKESDRRIMMMDVSVMPEMQRLYFQQLQREIMMRRSNARDLD